jgi:hypothetical protein
MATAAAYADCRTVVQTMKCGVMVRRFDTGSDNSVEGFEDLLDYLLERPNIMEVLRVNTGLKVKKRHCEKLAKWLASSSTLETLIIRRSISATSMKMIARALRVNRRLRVLLVTLGPFKSDRSIQDEFVTAIQINPERPLGSQWYLNGACDVLDYIRFLALKRGHPTMQMMLLDRC